jgi:hypothetical protein
MKTLRLKMNAERFAEITTSRGKYRVDVISFSPGFGATGPYVDVITAVPVDNESGSIDLSPYYPPDTTAARGAWREGFDVSFEPGSAKAEVVAALLADPAMAEEVKG